MRYIGLSVLVVALLAMAGLADAHGRVVINGGLLYKPHELPISGDGDFLVQGLGWQSWGGKTAVATEQAVEQVRPSHVDHTYPVRVTLSHRTFCANLHRTVYNEIVARIVGPNPGVFGGRALGRVYTCAGTWRLISPRSNPTGPRPPATTAHRCSRHGMPIAVRTITAEHSTCAKARTVVADWFARLKQPGGNACSWRDGSTRPGICTVQGWRCSSSHTVNGQTYPVTCTARRRRVHFVNEV